MLSELDSGSDWAILCEWWLDSGCPASSVGSMEYQHSRAWEQLGRMELVSGIPLQPAGRSSQLARSAVSHERGLLHNGQYDRRWELQLSHRRPVSVHTTSSSSFSCSFQSKWLALSCWKKFGSKKAALGILRVVILKGLGRQHLQ